VSQPEASRSTLFRLGGVLLAAALGAFPLAALPEPQAPPALGEKPHYRVPKATSAIKIDGVIEEAAWENALAFALPYEIDPGENTPAPVSTTAYLTYDEKHLYAAFRADDPDPSAIRAHITDRDTPFRDDFVGFMIDTFNDERSGFEFFVNPLGVQMDLSRTETGDEEEDEAWDTIWSSAGRIDERGYTVEIAIPYSSLRFQRTEGEQTWGIMPFRAYPRSLRHQLAAAPLDPNNSCFLCQVPKVTGFAGATPGRNLEIDPTVTARRTDASQDFPDSALEQGDYETDPGFTARWGMTPNLILSGAVNPDFSQVEADVAQLDVNTQFALFFPEKRPFFLEGADFFGTPYSIVHTRTVADPSWGAKLTGKEGRNGIGFFVTEDETTNFLLPGPQSSRSESLEGFHTTDVAFRYRRDLGASSTLGAVATHRQGGAYRSDVAGVDGLWRPLPGDTVTAQWLQSRTAYGNELGDRLEIAPDERDIDGSALRLGYDHGSRHWNWYARYEDIDPGFRADLGFMPRVGYSMMLGGLEHTWRAEDYGSKWYTSLSWGGDWDQTEGSNGTLLEREFETWVQLNGPLQSFYMIDTGWRDRFWNGVLFDERFTHFTFEMRPTGSLHLGLEATVADTIDFAHTRPGDLLRLNPSFDWNIGRNLALGFDHDLQRVDVDGGELLEVNLSQFRAVYQLNIRTFFRAVLQYTDIAYNEELYTAEEVPSEDEHLFSQLLFSYKLNPQTVFFLGYSDNQLGGEIEEGRFVELTRADRTFFMKIGYAWVL